MKNNDTQTVDFLDEFEFEDALDSFENFEAENKKFIVQKLRSLRRCHGDKTQARIKEFVFSPEGLRALRIAQVTDADGFYNLLISKSKQLGTFRDSAYFSYPKTGVRRG